MAKQVLVLDDNPGNRKILVFAMNNKLKDCNVHEAETRAEAERILSSQPFEIALLDIELPDGNGLDLAAQLRKESAEMILIMLSALDTRAELDRACAVGANAYVVKPFNLREVLKLLDKLEVQPRHSASGMWVLHSQRQLYEYKL